MLAVLNWDEEYGGNAVELGLKGWKAEISEDALATQSVYSTASSVTFIRVPVCYSTPQVWLEGDATRRGGV